MKVSVFEFGFMDLQKYISLICEQYTIVLKKKVVSI